MIGSCILLIAKVRESGANKLDAVILGEVTEGVVRGEQDAVGRINRVDRIFYPLVEVGRVLVYFSTCLSKIALFSGDAFDKIAPMFFT